MSSAPRNATLLTQPPADPAVLSFSVGAAGSRPVAPIKGYVYSNTTELTIEQWTGLVWRVVGKLPEIQIPVSGGPTNLRPINPRLGYLYTDVTLGQLVSWTGTTWLVIGPITIAPPAARLIPPVIITQPASQTVTAGTGATFTVTATGTGVLAYQWFKNDVTIGGATGSSYSIGSAAQTDGGAYKVTVTDAQGSTTSQPAVLTVAGAPYVVVQPSSQTVTAGSVVTFSISATGTGPLSYQWKFNGSPIAGANATTYAINGVASGDAGNYTCTVTNGVGSATSSAAALVVTTVATSARWSSFTGIFAAGADAFSPTALGMTIYGTTGFTTGAIATVSPADGVLPPGVELSLRNGSGTLLFHVISSGGETSLAIPFTVNQDGAYTLDISNPGGPLVMIGVVNASSGPGRFGNCSLRCVIAGPILWPPDGFAMALSTTTLTSGAYVDMGFYQGTSANAPMAAPFTWSLNGNTTDNPVLGYFVGGPGVQLSGNAVSSTASESRLEITAP